MLQKLNLHLDQNLPFLKGKRLIIACSGGLDSVVLAFLLKELQEEFALAHCNFSLRGKESDADEAFVADLAETFSLPVFTETFDTKKYAEENKVSVQMAARELRYRWFDEILTDFKYDYVLTAHHADDSLETFLINLSRSSGLRGLTGIPMQNGSIIRPLLPFSRDQLLEYAKQKGLYWREDSSNAKTDYLRNQLRINVIPEYKKAASKLLKSFEKTQQYLTNSQYLVEDYMALIYSLVISENKDGYEIDIKKLKGLPHYDAVLYELLHDFGFTAWDDVSKLLNAQSGKQVSSASHRLVKHRDKLLLTAIPSEAEKEEIWNISEGTKGLEEPVRLRFFENVPIEHSGPFTSYFDKELLRFPLQLRKWKEGDSFQPLGMKGKKKLSKFFKDEKLSLVAKEKTWVLCSNGHIVWVVGMRQDDRFKITPKTVNNIKIEYSPS